MTLQGQNTSADPCIKWSTIKVILFITYMLEKSSNLDTQTRDRQNKVEAE
jgi:hypothetical protein